MIHMSCETCTCLLLASDKHWGKSDRFIVVSVVENKIVQEEK